MRYRGGQKMQAISNKYKQSTKYEDLSAADRFTVKVEIAQHITYDISQMNSKLCKDLMREVGKNVYTRKK